MCNNAIYYNGTQLWTHWDNDISSNTLNFEFFTYQSNNQNKLQAPKFKFVIYSQSSNSSSVSLFNSELYKYNYMLKKKIMDNLNIHINEISKDKKYTDGFTFKTKRNNLYTTILYNNLIDSPCVRIMIGEKEQSILDTDKVYIPLIEFNSLYLTIGKSFDNYCVMSQQVTLLDHLKKFNDIFEDKINNISSKIDNIQIDTTSGKNISSEDIKKDIFENVSLDDSTEKESTVDVNDKVDKTEQNDFDTFLTENRDGFELDLPKEDPKTQKEISRQNFFTEKLLKNDFSNLDMIVNNCVNSKLPLDSFVKTVYSLSGVDLYEGISNSDKYCLNYVVTNNLRQSINSYIQKRIDLPKSINPIIINDKICNQDKIDCVCFLLLSYIFLSKIKNDCVNIEDSYANKNYISYCLKMITSPFVFTHILDINKDVLVNCIVRLYVELKDKKFYDKYLSDIFNKTHVNVDFNVTYLKDQIEKIYDNIQKFKDKLVVKNFFRKWMKLQYPDFDKFNIDYDSEIMECVLDIENNKNVSSTNKIPMEILNKFGISDVKFNNEILIRYIKSKCKDFGDLEQIKNINLSVNDIIDKIDLNNYSLDILKALYFWNVNLLPKDITYDKFLNIVESSNLTENELISMILHNNYKIDDDFYNSLTISHI